MADQHLLMEVATVVATVGTTGAPTRADRTLKYLVSKKANVNAALECMNESPGTTNEDLVCQLVQAYVLPLICNT